MTGTSVDPNSVETRTDVRPTHNGSPFSIARTGLTGIARHFASTILIMFLLNSCSSTPYDINVTDINLDGYQHPARIRLGKPQVLARETLVNDRRRERTHIAKLIDDSVKEKFEPQLRRELAEISAFAAQLGVGFNPTLGAQNAQAQERLDLVHEIEKKKLEAELTRLQQQLDGAEAAQTATASDATGESGDTAQSGATADTPTIQDPPSADLSAITEQLSGLVATAKDLLKPETSARASAVPVSPEDFYHDLRAYRAELRADEAAVNLDDIHDSEGNTLYRLQLRATLLPGEVTDQFGVAMVDVEEPVIKRRELNSLYYGWLAYATRRLNRDDGPDPHYQRLGAATELFEVVHIPATKNAPSGASNITRIATHPGASYSVQNRVCDAIKAAADEEHKNIFKEEGLQKFERNYCYEERLEHLKRKLEKYNFNLKRDKCIDDEFNKFITEKNKNSKYNHDNLMIYKEILSSAKSVEAAIIALQDKYYKDQQTTLDKDQQTTLDKDQKTALEEITDLLSVYDEEIDGARDFFEEIRKSVSDDCEWALEVEAISTSCPPPEFMNAIAKPRVAEKECPNEFTLSGDTATYAAMPNERVQRISTVAGAANAVQIAGALSAVLPTKGLNANLGAGAMRGAMGKVDALERSPIIVGFADVTSENAEPPENAEPSENTEPSDDRTERARFGWVFGPPIQIEPSGNQLTHRHVVATHRVMADVAVPAWWPRLKLNVQSAWIGNWTDPEQSTYMHLETKCRRQEADGDDQESDWFDRFLGFGPASECDELMVKLDEPRPVDFEALTSHLAALTLQARLREARIEQIEPERVSSCAKKVQFQVVGPDIWSGTEAYLHGQKASSYVVLPSMEGAAVEFDVSKIHLLDEDEGKAKLVVWTRRGTADGRVTIAKGSCPASKPSPDAKVLTEKVEFNDRNRPMKIKIQLAPGVASKFKALRQDEIDGIGARAYDEAEIGGSSFDMRVKGFEFEGDWPDDAGGLIVVELRQPEEKKDLDAFCALIAKNRAEVRYSFIAEGKKMPNISGSTLVTGQCRG